MSAPEPEWDDRAAAIDALAERERHLAGSGPYDEDEVRANVAAIYDRTVEAAPPGADMAARHRSNQMATPFAAMDSGARWRERLGSITAPTLVIHGEDDGFFPVGNARALADEIPGAELLLLAGVGAELPRRSWGTVVPALVMHTARG